MRRSIPLSIVVLCCIKLALSGAGCAVSDAPMPPITTPTTTPANLVTTQPYYWTTQPAVVTVTGPSFTKLWNACADVAREYGFRLDRQELRSGLMTTEPLVGQQFFELWAHNTGDAAGVANNSIATYRRTVRFEIEREGGKFVMSPCVLVERYAQAEQPISSEAYLRSSMATPKNPTLGTRETDRGVYLPHVYWYATGRDRMLERELAHDIEKKLKR
ncbi:MAG TPA: hypothetical protein VF669_09585 [Tepidisphaeraceae bacterium]|jgi:hypothetical protein